MMKEIIVNPVFAAFLLIAVATSLFAQNKKDTIANKDELMIELSKTGENHKLLSSLTGEWAFAGKHFSLDPNKKPFEFNGTAVRKAIMDGRFFIFETTSGKKLVMPWSDGMEVTYRDMSIEGYDNIKKKFVNATIENHWGTGVKQWEGIYDHATKTITYEAEIERVPGAKTKVRHVLKIISSDHYILEVYVFKEDQEFKASEISYTRMKG